MNLTKSKFFAGQQCPKILWMDKNMPEQKAEQDDSRMKTGLMVSDLVIGYFGAFTQVPFGRENISEIIAETGRLLKPERRLLPKPLSPITAIFSAWIFSVKLAMVKILEKLYEVAKSVI